MTGISLFSFVLAHSFALFQLPLGGVALSSGQALSAGNGLGLSIDQLGQPSLVAPKNLHVPSPWQGNSASQCSETLVLDHGWALVIPDAVCLP
ncbi:hypothetical protein [Pseudomonas khavaziana]|uniref:hypothetical protein n=1 Tax=Pseudomonas khavaziana TaxID=2842351 RepID=UPI001CED2A2E|nr:hypothetical protein [Pseudomonas khavaziana]